MRALLCLTLLYQLFFVCILYELCTASVDFLGSNTSKFYCNESISHDNKCSPYKIIEKAF